MGSNTAKLNSDEMKTRRELLREILDRDLEKPIFEKLLEFYENIFSQDPDLIVFMCRKSWCVIHLFLPFLEEKGIRVDRKKLTHDRMLHPWFAELDPEERGKIKVFLLDDTFQTGRAIDKCLRRLKYVYNVDEKNLTVAVFAVVDNEYNKNNKQRIDTEKKIYTIYPAKGKPSFKVNWDGGDAFCDEKYVKKISSFFVEALHACSVPYVGYIPAFRLPIEDVYKFLGAERGKEIGFDDEPNIRIPGYLEQDDLKAPLNDPAKIGYYNITNQQMRQHDVEVFYFSLLDDGEAFYLPALDSAGKHSLPFFPPKHAFSIAALRFYLNRKTGFALIVPYISLKDCRAEADIVGFFPEELRPLMREMCSTEEWDEFEGHLAAYRLLRFAVDYLWAKYVLKHWFPDTKEEDKEIVSLGGICSDKFFAWLDGPSVEQELTHIWSFFAPKENNVVEKPLESETSLDDIIQSDMPDDAEYYKDVIDKSLTVPDAVDYFTTASMIFRNIFTQENEIQYEHKKKANKGDSPLIEQFHGFPIHAFFSLLLLKFPKLKTRRDVLTTVTLMLCDTGIAVTQSCQRNSSQHGKVIGTVLFNGEQSCHSLALVAPEYAHFLTELPGMLLKFDDKEQRQEKFEWVRDEIEKYFKEEISEGIVRRLSLERELIPHLDYIGKNILKEDARERKFEIYSALPRSSFFDCSELFFLKMRKELTP